jgi:Spy/CpxP family protein refolding chaperone
LEPARRIEAPGLNREGAHRVQWDENDVNPQQEIPMRIPARLVFLLAAATLAGTAGLAVTANGAGRGAAQRTEPPAGRLLGRLTEDPALQEKLHLGKDQIDRLKQIRSSAVSDLAAMRGQVIARRGEMQSLLLDPQSSREALADKAAQVGAAAMALRKRALDLFLDARDVLNVDQRLSVREMIRTSPRRGAGGRRRMAGGAGLDPLAGDLDEESTPDGM